MKFVRIICFGILIFCSWMLAEAAWRLPLDVPDGYFTELGSSGTSGLPFAKSELVLAALITLSAAYLLLAFSKNITAQLVLSLFALIVTAFALGHHYGQGLAFSDSTIGYTRSGESKALSAPVSNSQSVQILSGNSPVMLTGRSGEYYRAIVAGGRTAWIPADRIIVP